MLDKLHPDYSLCNYTIILNDKDPFQCYYWWDKCTAIWSKHC